ncbi:PD-(D/E)XK motif protein [Pseudidiomarina terrestris]|uniref:PD-(D/E)XK motif protein n=1 Tax=Pseudidiomarina terrestris TaxID=2820060 RepID=UPI0026500744|nr:PD-(D/E)XK motif protein [Pseudidiomarina sp. 1ASP75-5]MDN7135986.1 PD-(D/E)XK motif protein [Pseudidiomarina sp. 1ASP75-5]
MISRQEKIKRVFDELLNDYGYEGQRVRKRIDHSSPINLYAARSFPQNNVLLEVGPIKRNFLPGGFTRPHIQGLNIRMSSSQKAGGGDITLLLELQQPRAIDVFTTFVARICAEMDGLQSPTDAVKAMVILIERWKEFFSGNSELLSEARQTGLYGELYLMSKLYEAGVPLSSVVKAWTGSKRTSQDYEFDNASIEVKSSAAVSATTVSITNARQLDDTGLDILLLARILFDARQGIEHSLPKLINYLREVITEHAVEVSLDFEEKLLLAKYRDHYAEYYTNRTYSLRALEFYEVKEGFPRLLEFDLPTGITKPSYEIIIENCKAFERSAEYTFEVMRKCCD